MKFTRKNRYVLIIIHLKSYQQKKVNKKNNDYKIFFGLIIEKYCLKHLCLLGLSSRGKAYFSKK